MADEKEQVQPETEEQVNEQPNEEKSIEELSAEIEARLAEKFKNEIAGLNRKISEKDKELKAKDLEAMSAEEKAAALAKQAEEAEARIKAAEKKLAVDSALNEVGLPLDLAERVRGETEDDIKADVAKMKAYFDDLITKSAEQQIAQALKGNPPNKQEEGNGKMSAEEIAAIPSYKERIKAYKANGFM